MGINDLSNFREISIGKISPGILYRSSHPIYDGNQVEDVVLCAKSAEINTVLNLSDSLQSLRSKVSCCPWYDNIVRKNNVIALDINMNFNIMENKFSKKIRQCILFMIEHEPPYLIHCEAGTARTGFLSIILEAFMEAKFDDMVKDYMLSYVDGDEYSKNDYDNGARVIKNLFGTIKGGLINTDDNLRCLSEKYFIGTVKLTDEELMKLRKKIMNKTEHGNAKVPGIASRKLVKGGNRRNLST